MPEPKEQETPKSGCGGCLLGFAIVLVSLVGLGYAINYYVNLNKNQRVEQRVQQRKSMPPHVVPFEYLTRLPEGETYVDGESVIVEGYLISDEHIPMGSGGVHFSLSERPVTGEQSKRSPSVSYSVRVRISCCNSKCQEAISEPRSPSRVNCQSYREFQEGPNRYFTNLTVYSDSGEMIRGSKVRLHGKLYMQKRSEETNKVDSELVVSKIEEIKVN